MDKNLNDILTRKLAREKAARKQAEAILEQKSAELYELTQELKSSNSQLETLVNQKTTQLKGVFENFIDSYVVMDLSGNVLSMNDASVELFGYGAKEDLNVARLIYKDDYAYAMESFKNLLEQGFFTNYKARIFTKDKKIKWVHINASLIYDQQGQPTAAQGIVRDITESHKNTELIAEQKMKLSAIVDNSTIPIVLTQEGQIVQTNPAAQNLFLYSEEELKNFLVKDITAPSKYKASNDLMTKMNQGLLDQFEIKKEYLQKGGTTFIAKTNVIAVRNSDGSIRYQLAIIEDITEKLKNERERKRLLDSLESQRQKYSNIIANMNLGLIEVDNEDQILMVNNSFEKMSGYSEEELLGKTARQMFLTKEGQLKVEKENERRKEGASNSYEVVAKTKKNQKRHWLISGAPNVNSFGEVTGSIGIHLDITELKNLERQKEKLLERLERSNADLQEYAHIISHDLKSPLRSIWALVNWIKEDNIESFDQSSLDNIALLEGTLEKMEQLISDVLSYSRAGSEVGESITLDLNAVIEEVRGMIYIPETTTIKVIGTLPTIEADKARIHQLFQNLIVNAIKYNDKPKGEIQIWATDTPTHNQISIKDDGIGIKKEFHEKIFKIFQSLQQDDGTSSGIGLSLVKKIVSLYGGEIWVESEEGKGSTFHFTLRK
ncbi:MAG: PAS domain S-box protein [Gilvibacter sp.]